MLQLRWYGNHANFPENLRLHRSGFCNDVEAARDSPDARYYAPMDPFYEQQYGMDFNAKSAKSGKPEVPC